MSREVAVIVRDDIDRSPADCTVIVGWEGQWHELDLTHAHRDNLLAVLEPWLDAGRKIDAPADKHPLLSDVRALRRMVIDWGKHQGGLMEPERTQSGSYYLHAELLRAFEAAHSLPLGSTTEAVRPRTRGRKRQSG